MAGPLSVGTPGAGSDVNTRSFDLTVRSSGERSETLDGERIATDLLKTFRTNGDQALLRAEQALQRLANTPEALDAFTRRLQQAERQDVDALHARAGNMRVGTLLAQLASRARGRMIMPAPRIDLGATDDAPPPRPQDRSDRAPRPPAPGVLVMPATSPRAGNLAAVQQRVDKLVQAFARGSRDGVLDALHGLDSQSLQGVVSAFNRDPRNAPTRSHGTVTLNSFEDRASRLGLSQNVAFQSYLNSPSGEFQAHHYMRLALDGNGVYKERVFDTYRGMGREDIQRMERDYQRTYGQSLTGELERRLSKSDRAELAMLRLGKDARTPAHETALGLYRAGPGRSGFDREALFGNLERNAGNLAEVRRAYAEIFPGRELDRDLRAAVRPPNPRAVSHDPARLDALLANRPADYVRQRADAFLRGGDFGAFAQTLAMVGSAGGPTWEAVEARHREVNPNAPPLMQSLRERAGREGAATLDLVARGQHTVDSLEARADRLRGVLTSTYLFGDRLQDVNRILGEIPPPERQDFAATYQRRTGKPLLDDVRRAFPDLATSFSEFGPVTTAPDPRRERLESDIRGATTPQDLLRFAADGAVRPEELGRGLAQLSYADRARFAAEYDRTNGPGSFQRTLARLPERVQRAVKAQLAAGELMGPQGAERLAAQARELLRDARPGEGFGRVSRWFTDTFAWSGPFLEESGRNLQRALDEAKAHGGIENPQNRERLQRAYGAFTRDFEAYLKDQGHVAEVASDIAAGAAAALATVATGGLLTPAALTLMAGTSVAAKLGTRAVLDRSYDTREAAQDAIATASFQVGAAGVLTAGVKAVGRTIQIVRTQVAQAADRAATRKLLDLAGSVPRREGGVAVPRPIPNAPPLRSMEDATSVLNPAVQRASERLADFVRQHPDALRGRAGDLAGKFGDPRLDSVFMRYVDDELRAAGHVLEDGTTPLRTIIADTPHNFQLNVTLPGADGKEIKLTLGADRLRQLVYDHHGIYAAGRDTTNSAMQMLDRIDEAVRGKTPGSPEYAAAVKQLRSEFGALATDNLGDGAWCGFIARNLEDLAKNPQLRQRLHNLQRMEDFAIFEGLGRLPGKGFTPKDIDLQLATLQTYDEIMKARGIMGADRFGHLGSDVQRDIMREATDRMRGLLPELARTPAEAQAAEAAVRELAARFRSQNQNIVDAIKRVRGDIEGPMRQQAVARGARREVLDDTAIVNDTAVGQITGPRPVFNNWAAGPTGHDHSIGLTFGTWPSQVAGVPPRHSVVLANPAGRSARYDFSEVAKAIRARHTEALRRIGTERGLTTAQVDAMVGVDYASAEGVREAARHAERLGFVLKTGPKDPPAADQLRAFLSPLGERGGQLVFAFPPNGVFVPPEELVALVGQHARRLPDAVGATTPNLPSGRTLVLLATGQATAPFATPSARDRRDGRP